METAKLVMKTQFKTLKDELVFFSGTRHNIFGAKILSQKKKSKKEKNKQTEMTDSSRPIPSVGVEPDSLPHTKTSEFTKELFLGKGSYGSVWLIRRHDNNKQYALKEVNLKDKQDSEK